MSQKFSKYPIIRETGTKGTHYSKIRIIQKSRYLTSWPERV